MLAYADFEKLCAGYELSKNDTKTLAGYFFRLGTFVHYADNPWLRDFVFLDNEWLTKGVYTIVDDDKVIKQQGRFSFCDLEATYHATVYQGEEAKFIELMNEFKICYEVEKHQYLCLSTYLQTSLNILSGQNGNALTICILSLTTKILCPEAS